MGSTNLFSFVESRQFGGPRHRLLEAEIALLRLRPRWSAPNFLPAGGGSVKHVVFLNLETFCLVFKGGHAHAFAVNHPSQQADQSTAGQSTADEQQPLRWLTDLCLFDEERMRLVAHMQVSASLLTVFSMADRQRRGRLYLRVLDAPSVLKGQVRTRSCGSLAATDVPSGGFVEYDSQNQCIWANDTENLRCWDAKTFQERFTLGPWGAGDIQNVRFTLGSVGLLKCLRSAVLEVTLHSTTDGRLERRCEVPFTGGAELTFLELINQQLLLKHQQSEVLMIDLSTGGSQHVIKETQDWEPELFVFLPSQGLMLARLGEVLEIWQCARTGGCCRLGTVRPVPDFGANRFSIEERLGLALVMRPPTRRTPRGKEASAAGVSGSSPFFARRGSSGSPPSAATTRRRSAQPAGTQAVGSPVLPEGESLALLDLLSFGQLRATLSSPCQGIGGGGVAHLSFDLQSGSLLLIGRLGGIFMLSSGEG